MNIDANSTKYGQVKALNLDTTKYGQIKAVNFNIHQSNRGYKIMIQKRILQMMKKNLLLLKDLFKR